MTAEAVDPGAEYAHILTDLHGIARELAAARADLAELRAAVDELLPAARRAAAMLDTPVTSFLAARREARADGQNLQRAATGEPRSRRPRASRRKLPDA